MISKVTRNLYEAAYYLTQGGVLTGVDIRKAHSKKDLAIGIVDLWYTHVDNIPEQAVTDWETDRATCNVRELEAARSKVKKFAHKHYAHYTWNKRPPLRYVQEAKEKGWEQQCQ
jgi:hypothetical protein